MNGIPAHSLTNPPKCPDCGRGMTHKATTVQPYWRCEDSDCEGTIKADATGALKYAPRKTSHKRVHGRVMAMFNHLNRVEKWSDDRIVGFVQGTVGRKALLKDLTEAELIKLADELYFDYWNPGSEANNPGDSDEN